MTGSPLTARQKLQEILTPNDAGSYYAVLALEGVL